MTKRKAPEIPEVFSIGWPPGFQIFFGARMCEILTGIERRIIRAAARYGDFASTHEALGVAIEEWDELREAIRSNDLQAVEHECMDLAAVLVRLARNMRDNGNTRVRSGK